jgi:hypothetical protein
MNADKDFAPYQPSLDMKELGFDEPCFGYYNVSNQELIEDLSNNRTGNDDSRWASAPLYSQAFRWFREKYDLVHRINRDGGYWICATLDLYDEADQGAIEKFIDCYPNTYEEAELACLNKLIEIVKNK